MSLEQILQKPKTKKAILRDRELVHVKSFEEILPSLEKREENQVVLIYPNVDIVPLNNLGKPQYYSKQNYSKRGPLIKLETFGKQQSLQRKHSPLQARIQARKKHKSSRQNFVGWYWKDPEGYAHIVQPWMVLEGRRIEMQGQKTATIENKTRVMKTYSAKDSHLKTAIVKVPSRSKREHEIVIQNLVKPTSPLQHHEWTRLSTRHECEIKTFDFGFRFQKIVTYCPHDIAAYVAYSRKIAKSTGKIIPQPFPMFREPTLRLYLSLLHDTLKIDITPKGKTKTRPLTYNETNPLLMHAWLKHGNFNTFDVPTNEQTRKKMRDYNWDPSAPGMKF
jgi:hypothetical protein